MKTKESRKHQFLKQLQEWAMSLNSHVSTEDGQWTIKGFIDVYKNVYTISSDTKILSNCGVIWLLYRLAGTSKLLPGYFLR